MGLRIWRELQSAGLPKARVFLPGFLKDWTADICLGFVSALLERRRVISLNLDEALAAYLMRRYDER
jgi:hypothetical protein